MSITTARRAVDVSRGFRPSARAERREPVDPCDERKALAVVEDRAWFVARCKAGGEARTVAALAERRVFAFTPVSEVWRRRNRFTKTKELYRFPAAPGYVVVGADPRFIPWMTIYDLTAGLLSAGGRPVRLGPQAVRRILAMVRRAEGYQRHMPSRKEWSAGVGDVLRVVWGPLEGKSVQLAMPLDGMTGDEARVLVEMFGTVIEAPIRIDCLEPVA